MFSEADILTIKKVCQEIINAPRSMEDQPHIREGLFLWCEDWEIIEICKYLFHGRDVYYADPPPNRLKRNPLWTMAEIEQKAEYLIKKFKTAELICEELRRRRLSNGGA